ncbi:hypothetical protein ACTFIW_009122 [Dictyostelium discoideum]
MIEFVPETPSQDTTIFYTPLQSPIQSPAQSPIQSPTQSPIQSPRTKLTSQLNSTEISQYGSHLKSPNNNHINKLTSQTYSPAKFNSSIADFSFTSITIPPTIEDSVSSQPKIKPSRSKFDGRCIVAKITDFNNNTYIIINIYAPNHPVHKSSFFNTLNNIISTHKNQNHSSPIILGCDFNINFFKKSNTMDRISLNNLAASHNLTNKWFEATSINPTLFRKGSTRSCLDTFFITNNTQTSNIKTTPTNLSDHNSIHITTSPNQSRPLWCLNTSTLKEPGIVEDIELLYGIQLKHPLRLSDPPLWWYNTKTIISNYLKKIMIQSSLKKRDTSNALYSNLEIARELHSIAPANCARLFDAQNKVKQLENEILQEKLNTHLQLRISSKEQATPKFLQHLSNISPRNANKISSLFDPTTNTTHSYFINPQLHLTNI